MKAVGLVALALVIGTVMMASAQEEQYAYSANAVGVIRKTIPAGKMVLVTMPFDDMMSTNAAIPFLELPFLSSLPNKSEANMWDAVSSKWVTGTKSLGKWSGAITNLSLGLGDAIFFLNGSKNDVTITMLGDVPTDSSIAIQVVPANHITGCANPYPSSFVFTNSVLAKQSKNGTMVSFWDVNTSQWQSLSKSLNKWSGATNMVVEPGVAFLYQSGKSDTNTSWTVVRPYTWTGM